MMCCLKKAKVTSKLVTAPELQIYAGNEFMGGCADRSDTQRLDQERTHPRDESGAGNQKYHRDD